MGFDESPLVRAKIEMPAQSPQNQASSSSKEIGQDLWKQLKRVSIPVFSGEKSTYQNWKAAFVACIDKAPATSEYKLLQLRQYLSGEALNVIENLGHSATTYEAAKSRLERKYGGTRRQIALYLEELENFKPIRMGSAKDLDKFADLLDIAVINLKEAGRHEELANGSLYSKLQKKMPEQMLAQYHRWIYENRKAECVEILREWIIQEAEFQIIASETVRGISSGATEPQRKARTFFGESKPQRTSQDNVKDRRRNCKACGQTHPIWQCEKFKAMSVPKRWETAKQYNMCYRCLGQYHVGRACTRSRICGLNGCRDSHNRLLHEDKSERQDQQKNSKQEHSASKNTPSYENQHSNQAENSVSAATEGEQQNGHERSHTTTVHMKESTKGEYVALRTVPVVLKNGERKLVVNALLDDASTKSYINSDIAAQLGLQGINQRVTVNVLNGQVDTFETMPAEFGVESLDGRTSTKVSAFTADRVTGNMKVIDWNNCAKKWNHLRSVNFPYLGPRPIVDVLIGIDYADLHYSIQDIRGNPEEPIARLTPLGWTCIGHPDPSEKQEAGHQTNFIRTYYVRTEEEELNSTLRKFWEVEDVPNVVVNFLKTEDQAALDTLKTSMKFENGQYEVGIPWKGDKRSLPKHRKTGCSKIQRSERTIQMCLTSISRKVT
ncbi:hypothetical protein QZH41_005502 [Actinostola sp. cb2023]|nr:hypothetical protein QZH41_005502 [Actinostola sp. cb2023]